MAHRPRWQSLSGMAVTAVLLISACSSGSPATTAPSKAPTSQAPASQAPASQGSASQAPASQGASSAPTTAATASAGTSSEPSVSAAPQGTAYPTPAAQPGDPTAITNAYPNYGEAVDCEADSWNGLPYTGNLKSLTAPDDH